jgi:sulfur carrier protein
LKAALRGGFFAWRISSGRILVLTGEVNSQRLMRYIAGMELFVNGEAKTCAEASSLAEFIQQLGMKGDRVAVELNREIVPRAQWTDTQLHDGDRLEVVHFVGGGADFL